MFYLWNKGIVEKRKRSKKKGNAYMLAGMNEVRILFKSNGAEVFNLFITTNLKKSFHSIFTILLLEKKKQ